MSEEKKPGLLKRIFSFGLGKKNAEAEEAAAEQALKEEAEAKAKQKREEAERLLADKAAAQEERRIAEAQAKAAAEIKARENAARQKEAEDKKKSEAAAQKAKAEAAAKTRAEAKAKQEREEAEAKTRKKLAAEKAASEKAEKEAAKKRQAEQQAAKDAERLEAEAVAEQERALAEETRLAEEKAEAARLEALEHTAPEPVPENTPTKPSLPSGGIENEADRREGWFKRLKSGLSRSSSNLKENITSVFTKRKLDEDTLQDLEDILIQADLGVETAMNITDALASQRMGKDVTDEEVRQVMADEIAKTLEPVAKPLELDLEHQPHVILVVGVNGSGKTTTIGKISKKLYDAGFSTLLVAGDTFRAAAIEQLHIWGERTQAPVMSRKHGADAAGLAFDAYAEAKSQKRDVMLMDTAGRLQNKKELMDELEKIIRVLKKQDPAAPHTVLLTLDATTGQNALNQVEIFKDVAGVNGLVMTKLDGTARGGILVSIAAKHKLPVYFIGVGEQVEDLEPFEADVFARAIAGLEVSNE